MTSRLHLILPAIFLLAFAGWLFSDEVAPPDLNSALKNVEQSLQQLQKEIKDLQGSVKDLSRSVKASRETRPVRLPRLSRSLPRTPSRRWCDPRKLTNAGGAPRT